MPGKILNVVGRLLVIWGAILPAIAFLWSTAYDPQRGVIDSVRWTLVDIPGTRIAMRQVAGGGLVMVGLGLSLLAAGRARSA